MFKCAICHGEESREEAVEAVFKVNGRYVQVEGVPATVCRQCGEPSFSRETAEKMRLLVHAPAKTARTKRMRVYQFA